MFERFTERARRTIFFSRYESHQCGATTIESEHMLLGLMREDAPLLISFLFSPDSIQTIRREIEERYSGNEKARTSADLPLSGECKQALAYATEESDALSQTWVGTPQLLLGLLRVENCFASTLLRKHGVDIGTVRRSPALRKADRPRPAFQSTVPVFRVASVVRSIGWYHDILGFTARRFGDPEDSSFAILRRDGVEIMIQKIREGVGEPRSATKAGGGWDAYIRVYDAVTLHEDVREKVPDLGPLVKTEYGCLEFLLTDPDGHVLVIGECSQGV